MKRVPKGVARSSSLYYPCPADFKQLHFPPPTGAQKPSINDYVRRRRWVRRRRRTGSKPAPLASLAAALGTDHKKPRKQVVTSRQVLGRAAPGEALPLPLGWSSPGRQLQLRPVLSSSRPASAGQQEQQPAGEGSPGKAEGQPPREESAEEAGQLHAAHDWSQGTADGHATLKLDGLDEGVTRLVCCSLLHNTGKWAVPRRRWASQLPAPASAAVPHCWRCRRRAALALPPRNARHARSACPMCSSGLCRQRDGSERPVVQPGGGGRHPGRLQAGQAHNRQARLRSSCPSYAHQQSLLVGARATAVLQLGSSPLVPCCGVNQPPPNCLPC